MTAIIHFVLLFGICAVASGNPMAKGAGAAAGAPDPSPEDAHKWKEYDNRRGFLVPKIKIRENKYMNGRLEICIPDKTQWMQVGGVELSRETLEKITIDMGRILRNRLKNRGSFMFSMNEVSADGTEKRSVFFKLPDDVVDNTFLGIENKGKWSRAVIQRTCFSASSGKVKPKKSFIFTLPMFIKSGGLKGGVFEKTDKYCNCDDV